ncbi:hypothetical protein [Peribacillus frigoritolerans]|uniref:hypothetical protein n=1 Tax=Peribacillus frigoritolerans TaxID=450367 RepID=UPI001070E02B|nr:hypothetical protein [Peribacillus frigoritolerans]TFH63505.1 hypothetical protein E4J71_07080 [Peribacillus frigoritolerans]
MDHSEIIKLIQVVGGIIVAILGVIFGGKLLVRKKDIKQNKGGTQIAFMDSHNNKVNAGEKDAKKKN